MNESLVTIVIPSLNQAEYLPAAIESALNQSIATEVFVMDGGSSDDSVAIIQNYESHLAGWVSEPDDGQSAAVNKGIAWGTAPFVTWLNSDDTLEENGLTNLHECLSRAPAAPAAYGRAIHINSNGRKVGIYRTYLSPFSILRPSCMKFSSMIRGVAVITTSCKNNTSNFFILTEIVSRVLSWLGIPCVIVINDNFCGTVFIF